MKSSGQASVSHHFDSWIVTIEVFNPLQAFFHGEKVVFVDVMSNGDDDLVEKRQHFGYNVLVPFRERTEGTGKNSDFPHFSVSYNREIVIVNELDKP